MSSRTHNDSVWFWQIGPALVAGLLLLGPQLASADTFILMMESGVPKKRLMADLSAQLKDAGHKTMVTGANLEDSAMMLVCDPS